MSSTEIEVLWDEVPAIDQNGVITIGYRHWVRGTYVNSETRGSGNVPSVDGPRVFEFTYVPKDAVSLCLVQSDLHAQAISLV